MSLTLTIAGVDVTASNWYLPGLDQPGQMHFSRQSGGLGPCTVVVYSVPGAVYRPNIDDTIVISQSGTDLYSGVITDVNESGLTDLDTGLKITITAQDHARVFNQVLYTQTYPTGTTLKAVLQDLVAGPFAPYSITLDVSQATGPTLDTMAFDNATGTAILNALQNISRYPWRLSPAKVLRMVLPGSEASGITLSDSSTDVIDSVTWRHGRSADYCNDVLVVAGGTTRADKTYTHPAVPPATTQVNFVFPYPVAATYGYITVDGVFTPIGITGVDAMAWTWDAAGNQIVASPAAIAGTVVEQMASVQFPIEATASDAGEIAAHGTYTKRFDAPTVFDINEAAQLAASYLRLGIETPRELTVRHRAGGAFIGQTVALSFAVRNVSGAWQITAVDAEDDVDAEVLYTFTCLEGAAETQPTWLDQARSVEGGAGASASGGTITGSVLPVPTGTFEHNVMAESADSRVELGTVGTSAGSDGAVGGGLQVLGSTPKWTLVSSPAGSFDEVRLLWWDGSGTVQVPFQIRRDTVLGGFCIMPGKTTNLVTPCYLGSNTDSFNAGRWTIVFAQDVNVSNGYLAHGRTVREGEWQDVTFNAAAFTADTGANWTLTSPDQSVLAYMLDGLTLDYTFELLTTTVVGTPLYLKIALPGGRVIRHTTSGYVRRCLDNNVAADNAMVVGIAGDNFIRIYKDKTAAANWTASTNLTEVRGVMLSLPVDF